MHKQARAARVRRAFHQAVARGDAALAGGDNTPKLVSKVDKV